LRATNGRQRPSSGVPYTRIMAAFMLATLISTLFALPANAAAGDLTFTNVSTPLKVLPNGLYSYTVTFSNASGSDVTGFSFTDTVTGGGTMTLATPSGTTVCGAIVVNATTCTTATFATATTVAVTFNVTAPALPGTVTNTVSGTTGTGIGTVTGTAAATTTVEDANLVVTKTHTGTTTTGGTPTYTIAIHNNGPSDASAVQLTDTAPLNVTFGTVTVASVTPAGITTCVPAPTTTSVACLFPTIVSGQTVNVTVPATLGAGATAGASIANTASVTSTTLDSVPANNSSTDTFVVGSLGVDLAVAITVDPTTAAPGDTVTYTVTVTNPSTTTDATGVVVTDALPAGLTAVTPPTAPTTGTAAVAANTWTWTIPTVAKAVAPATSNAVSASFTATVDEATTLTTITNTVTMTSTTTDPTSTNNTASADLTISADVADLNIVTAVDDSKPNQGDTIQIYIQVSNSGPADATNIVLKDVLPTGLKYESCEPTPCEQSGLRRQSSQLFTMPSVAADSAGTIVLHVTVQASSGTLQNTASVVSLDQTDPTDANNSDSLNITIGGAANNPGGSTGGTGGTGGTSGSTGGTTAFTGFTASQLMPWFMLLFSLGLVAIEWARRMRLVSPIGSTYGFEPFQG
jgi:uncharacterized repeat protein (TIGR01451 family)